MLVHVVMPKAEEAATAAAAEAAPAAARGRARGHQEGQDRREGRGERRRSSGGSSDPPKCHEAHRGSGQPGREYRETRHNVGFMVVEEIARRYALSWSQAPSQVPDVFIAKRYGPEPMLLAKPLTYMNLSGDAVAGLARTTTCRPTTC